MIGVRFLPREEWEKRLRRHGCNPLEGAPQLESAEWWRWPWGGYPFTVPVERDGTCDEWAITGLIVTLAKIAPDDWRFPDEPIH